MSDEAHPMLLRIYAGIEFRRQYPNLEGRVISWRPGYGQPPTAVLYHTDLDEAKRRVQSLQQCLKITIKIELRRAASGPGVEPAIFKELAAAQAKV